MREILFRGKRIDNGDWVSSGNIIRFNPENGEELIFIPGLNEKCTCTHDEMDNIIAFDNVSFYKVDPMTVGQFTGLIDTNGKQIFEGDIVHVHDQLLRCDKPYHEFDGVIEHKYGSFVIVGEIMTHFRWIDYDVAVLGNIHDNPELLEV